MKLKIVVVYKLQFIQAVTGLGNKMGTREGVQSYPTIFSWTEYPAYFKKPKFKYSQFQIAQRYMLLYCYGYIFVTLIHKVQADWKTNSKIKVINCGQRFWYQEFFVLETGQSIIRCDPS